MRMVVRGSRLVPACALLMLCGAPAAHAQTPSTAASTAAAPLPVYDVVTIKPNKTASGSVSVNINENTFTGTNLPLKNLIAGAYDVHTDQLLGLPEWANGAHYDISAKSLDSDAETLRKLTPKQRGNMMLPVLIDRFKIKVHTETKTLPVYHLVLAKGGSKMKAFVDSNTPDSKTGNKGGGWMSSRNTTLTATGIETSDLANYLTERLHRTVIDETGLKGKFSYTLDWTPDPNSGDTHESTDASLITALQDQLGLKLEAAKGPVDAVVIDHIEMPTED